jgi:3-oxoacyl-[acyl-carrier protein] reductase
LVVGASGVIGGAVARALSAAGHPVGLHYCTNRAAVERVAEVISAEGGEFRLLSCGLSDLPACTGLIDAFKTEFPKAGGLALCAGRVPWQSWQDLDGGDWERVLFEHCVVPVAMATRALQTWSESCRVTYLSSISPKYGGSELTLHYAAAKAAMETAMLGLSRNTASRGGRVNGIRAGFVDSPQHQGGRSPEDIANRIAKIPIGRAILSEEIAEAARYFLSPMAEGVTGQLLAVAGGD